ncbi:MAG: ImmA/IrrE family metallo-endopeptidase [Pseudomonadota bacterium]
MEDVNHFKCPFIDKEKIWHEADVFRAIYWPEGVVPVDMEKIVESRLKLNIEPEHNLREDYDIDAWFRRDGTGFVVDYKQYMDERFSNRMRFSFAHEIGHLVLHKDLYASYRIDALDDWKTFTCQIPEREYKFVEYQANEFAGRLLVPVDRLRDEINKCLTQIEEQGVLDYLLRDPDAALSRLSPALCKPFGVSDQVVKRRAEREGLWPPRVERLHGTGFKLIK